MSANVSDRIALVIVDLQNDFLAADGAYARGSATSEAARSLPPRLADVANAVRTAGGLVIASLFTLWPDCTGEPMVASHLKALRPFLRRGDFAPGSHGQACVPAIAPMVDVTISKVAYSAFFETQLDWVLRHAGVATVAVCGIVTNGGVASTVRDAHMRGYHTVVLENGCAAFDPRTHEVSIADMRSIAQVIDCESFARSMA